MMKLREKDSIISCGVFTSDLESFNFFGGGSVLVGNVKVTTKTAMGNKMIK